MLKPYTLLSPMKIKGILIAILAIGLYPLPAQASGNIYWGTCSYSDNGNDNGGSVSDMPCYVHAGGDINGSFFYVKWDDGIINCLSSYETSDGTFIDKVAGRSYIRVGDFQFAASDGDVITAQNLTVAREFNPFCPN